MSRTRASAPDEQGIGVDMAVYEAVASRLVDRDHWSAPPEDLLDNLRVIKSSLKTHFYLCQSRRCCYCSIELHNYGPSIHLEHVISRDERPDFMLSLNNLAAACGPCNGAKSAKGIMAEGVNVAALVTVPVASEAYAIVHPQFDEWSDHFVVDEFSRVRWITIKGGVTIKVCGIEKLNAARLSDHFALGDRPQVLKVIVKVGSYKQAARKTRAIQLLKELAARGSERAKVAVERIEMELT